MEKTDDRQRRTRPAQSRQTERYDRQPRRQPSQYQREAYDRRRDGYDGWEQPARRSPQNDRRRSTHQPSQYDRRESGRRTSGTGNRERSARQPSRNDPRRASGQPAAHGRQGQRYDREAPARRQTGYDASRRGGYEEPRRELDPAERRRREQARRRRREQARRRRRRQQCRNFLLLLLVIGVMIAVVCIHGSKAPEVPETRIPTETPTEAPTEAPTKPPLEVTVISGLEDLATLEVPDYVDVQIIDVDGDSRRGVNLTGINAIVIHYVGNPGTTARQNRSWYADSLSDVSSHFVVGLEGEVIQCIPLNEKASASNERNADTISIEVCHPDSSGKFNQATYDTLVELTAWVTKSCGLEADNVIRHYDVTGKECPIYFVKNEDAWLKFKAEVAERMG